MVISEKYSHSVYGHANHMNSRKLFSVARSAETLHISNKK